MIIKMKGYDPKENSTLISRNHSTIYFISVNILK